MIRPGEEPEQGMGRLAVASVLAAGEVLAPDAVAEAVLAGVRDGRFLILPHPEVGEFLLRKAGDPDRWLAGMQRLRRAMEQPPPA
jgi:hypothetical protein